MSKPQREETFGRVFATLGRYAPVSYAILDDLELSPLAVRAAAVLARGIVYHKGNKDGHVDTTYAELGRKIGKSRRTAWDAVQELVKHGHVITVSLNRGGVRVAFLTRHQEFDLDGYWDSAGDGFFDRDRSLDEQLAELAEATATEPNARKLQQDLDGWLRVHPKLTAQDYSDALAAHITRFRAQDAKREQEFTERTGKEYEVSTATWDRNRRKWLQLPIQPVRKAAPERT